MSPKLSTNLSIILVGIMISCSIILSSEIKRVSNKKLLNEISNIRTSLLESTSNREESLINIEKSLKSPINMDKELYEHLFKNCLSISTVGFSNFDTDRRRHCMNQILNSSIE